MKTKRMMVVAALMMATLGGMTACSMGSTTTVGGLTYEAEDLKPKSFSAVDVDAIADVYYTQNDGDECSVKLDFSAIKDAEQAERMKQLVKVVYRNGGVEIGFKKQMRGASGSFEEGKRLKVYITSPDLVKITQEGVGSFHAKSINTDKLDIDNEGVGSVYIEKLLANKLSIDNEGVGSVDIQHVTGDDVYIDNEGVGKVSLGFFKGGKLKIDNEGVGGVSAKVDCQYIHAELDGVGGISLSGVTRKYSKSKDGVGRFDDRGLKVLE